MTEDDIVVMAVNAGASALFFKDNIKFIQKFAKLVAQHEREACAKVCDEFNFGQAPQMIQKAIRARGQA